MANTNPTADSSAELPFPAVRDVSATAPLRWISRGFDDFRSCPVPSLFYGFCFAAMGLLATIAFERSVEYTYALTLGFMLLAPFLAMGLYEISRRRERDEGCSLVPTLTVWRRNMGNIGLFALVLGVIFLVWTRASLIIFALFHNSDLPNLSGFLAQLLSPDNLEFILVYFGVGFIFALIVFAVSVVSIPMMLDRDRDAISSMLTSISALAHNPWAMLVWACFIVGFTMLGFLTFHLGLVVLMPIIGHATWHAYRDLVVPDAPSLARA